MHIQTARHSLYRALFVATVTFAPIALAQHSLDGPATEAKTVEQVYKNIAQLKGTPAEQLMPAMQVISSSLGVDCSFCHVVGKAELDDKPAKKTARLMMAMVASINAGSFGGRQQVSCYSCHHGVANPANVPPVLETDAVRAGTNPAPPVGAAPTADDVIQKYVTAMGGAEAIRKITSRV